MLAPRSSGIFLHVTSLPGPYGIGDLGRETRRFVDWLARAGQRYWQVLPVGPVGPGASPYSSPSAFAGSPLLIDLDALRTRGLLTADDLAAASAFPAETVDYDRVIPFKMRALTTAFERFEADASSADERALDRFAEEQAAWLDNFALFMALHETHDAQPWTTWPSPLRDRRSHAIEKAREKHRRAVRRHTFWQHLFAEQWQALRRYGSARDVRLFGDVPIYVAHHSADVWAHQELFALDADGQPTVVSGVPPDYFSETGQRWGNPLYRWDRMAEDDFAWWTRRMQAALRHFDLVRLDHFRGFEAYWEIPAEEETAINGTWVEGPGPALFEALEDALGELPVVAEDLGVITPGVRALMDRFEIPGMAVLPFGLESDPTSEYLPHHYHPRLVAYTSTHDTDTLCGWYAHAPRRADFRAQDDDPSPAASTPDAAGAEPVRNDADKEGAAGKEPDTEWVARPFAQRYLDLASGASIHRPAIRALTASSARRVIFPMQDVLGLGSEARMNTPGLGGSNWRWRLTSAQLDAADAAWLSRLAETFDRVPGRAAASGDDASEDPAEDEPPVDAAEDDLPPPPTKRRA